MIWYLCMFPITQENLNDMCERAATEDSPQRSAWSYHVVRLMDAKYEYFE